MTSNIKPKPSSKEAPNEPFKRAVTGCLRGIESGRSAASVGAAATSAVVSGILAIIITDAVFAVLLNIVGL